MSTTTQKITTQFTFHEKSKNAKGSRRTIVATVTEKGMQFGMATCGPRDQFNRKIGREIAIGRSSKTPFMTLVANYGEDNRELFYNTLKHFAAVEAK